MTRTATDPKPEAEQTPGLSTWLPLAVVCLALGVEAYDASSIPVAISAIVSDLQTDLSTIQAALVLFSVICAPLMLTSGTSTASGAPCGSASGSSGPAR
jgi:hypothetical protein